MRSRVLKLNAARLRFIARNEIGNSPLLYELARRWPYWRNQRAVSHGTELCIEGYPRSANSTLCFAVREWNPEIRLAHHIHVPQQILCSIRLGVPAVALIRRPDAAVASSLLRREWLTVGLGLRYYIRFYEALLQVRQRIVVGVFDDVIRDPGSVVRSVNAQYGTSFNHRPWTAEEQERVLAKTRNKPATDNAVRARGTKLKDETRNHALYPRAMEVYDAFCR